VGRGPAATAEQDLTAQRKAARTLGVNPHGVYVDHGLTGTGQDQQPKLGPRQEAHLVQLYRAGEHTIGELEELFTTTRSTVYLAAQRACGRTTAPTVVMVQR